MAPSPIVVVPRPEIEQAVAGSEPALLEALAKGFIDFSQGKVEVAKPSHMQFASVFNPGEACVKTGCVRDSGRWTVKVASTFHNNAKLGLSNSQGVMLVFKEKTGELEGCLADGGHLTDLRTSLTAVLCVREFGPGREFGPVVGANRVLTVAIFGTGTIAHLIATQLLALKVLPRGTKLIVVSRTDEAADRFGKRHAKDGWELVEVPGVQAAVEGAQEADIVILCTPSQQPLLARCKRGALVIALGADADGKRELGPYVWWDAKAQGEGEEAVRHSFTTLADSRSQCLAFGELRYATDEKLIDEESIWEIGDQLGMPTGHAERVRAGLERTVVIDLTGVAVQDVVIAGSVLDAVVRARAVAPPPIATKPTPERSGQPKPAKLGGVSATKSVPASSRMALKSDPPKHSLPNGRPELGSGLTLGALKHAFAPREVVPPIPPTRPSSPTGDSGGTPGEPEVWEPEKPEPSSAAKGEGKGGGRKRAAGGSGGGKAGWANGHEGPARKVSGRGSRSGVHTSSPPPPAPPLPKTVQEEPDGAPWSEARLNACVGRKLRVWWDEDEEWYEGTVEQVKPLDHPTTLRIHYYDGDKRWYDNHDEKSRGNMKWHRLKIEWADGKPPPGDDEY